MAIANRTRDLIERSLRPGSQSAEVITALNNASLNTVLSYNAIRALHQQIGARGGNALATMLAAGSKTNVAAATGQDSWVRQGLFQWLKDRDAANDVFTQIATVV